MRILKVILYVVLALVALVLILGLFVKKDYHVEREVVIHRPLAEVFDYVKFLKNQENYSKWLMIDPDMDKSYRGVDGTVGSVLVWDGDNKVGAGEMEIVALTENQRIDYGLRFREPFESVAASYMTVERISERDTKVTWAFDGRSAYPFNVICLFMDMDKMIGGDLQTGLDNLKRIQEAP